MSTLYSKVYVMRYNPPRAVLTQDLLDTFSVMSFLLLFYFVKRMLRRDNFVCNNSVIAKSVFTVCALTLFKAYLKGILLSRCVQKPELPAADIAGVLRLLAYQNYTLIVPWNATGHEQAYHKWAQDQLGDSAAVVHNLRVVPLRRETEVVNLLKFSKQIAELTFLESGSAAGFQSKANRSNFGLIQGAWNPCCFRVKKDLRHLIQVRALRADENGLTQVLLVHAGQATHERKRPQQIGLNSMLLMFYACGILYVIAALLSTVY